ncbi:MAG: CHAD domain-containing protein [Cyanobacteriota bacterium]|nr:CHAD domain-containing protein [Cyanobacteriota bacterium]
MTNDKIQAFGDWARVAIDQHSHKMFKHEPEVLKDKDPEELHQMRVGMRRLRSAMAGFSTALDLPASAREKKVSKVAKILGQLRDLDVLGEALETEYKPTLPKKEQKELAPSFKILKKRRSEEVARVKKTLKGKTYNALKHGLKDWLEHPQYQKIGDASIELVLPDILLPQASQLLLHPGWFAEVETTGEELQDDAKTVEKLLEENEETLHDLRKEAKRSRYQMELFASFYGEDYDRDVKAIKKVQSILGEIQDSFVLAEFLDKTLDKSIDKCVPTLAAQLRQNRYQKWQTWRTIREEFRDRAFRDNLRLTLQKPNSESSS